MSWNRFMWTRNLVLTLVSILNEIFLLFLSLWLSLFLLKVHWLFLLWKEDILKLYRWFLRGAWFLLYWIRVYGNCLCICLGIGNIPLVVFRFINTGFACLCISNIICLHLITNIIIVIIIFFLLLLQLHFQVVKVYLYYYYSHFHLRRGGLGKVCFRWFQCYYFYYY